MAKDIIFYTNAPEAYDGFGTQTIEITEYLDHRGKPVRKISVPESAVEWQKNRNASGNNSTFTESEFEQYKDTIFTKKQKNKQYDWDFDFSGGKSEGLRLSDLKLQTIDVYDDNIASVEFDNDSISQLKVSELIGLLSITDNPVKISVIFSDNKLTDTLKNQKIKRRLQKIANDSGRYIANNPDKRDSRMFPYIFISENDLQNYELASEFNEKLSTPRTQLKKELKDFYSKEQQEAMATELETQTKIVESISETEKNKSPLTETSLQNPEIKDLSYQPESDSCRSVDTVVPESMRYDMHKAIETVDRRVNGVDEYVAEKLGYIVGNCTLEQRKEGLKCLCDAFSAEQVDAIAVAIYNIEQKKQGCIIGDQTGIGKGRIAAGMIRYAIMQGLKPIFLTEKPNLFTDLFRDIINIGSDSAIPTDILVGTELVSKKATKKDAEEEADEADAETTDQIDVEEESEFIEVEKYAKNSGYPNRYTFTQINENGVEETITRVRKVSAVPFIINGGGKKTQIKDEQGNILYKGNSTEVSKITGKLVKTGELNAEGKPIRRLEAGTMQIPEQYNFILATYSQFNKGADAPKSKLLLKLAENNIVIMDESHNASGESNIGIFLAKVLSVTKGVTFLSATFAKRPDNMPIYAGKTCMSDANMTDEQLVGAIVRGGVALQEIVSSNLVAEGQMIRRERSFEGIEVNYKYLDSSQTEAGYPNLDLEQKHRAIMDKATDIIRSIMNFQTDYVNPLIEKLDKEQKSLYKEAKTRRGTTKAGVDNPPVFSGVFNVINQLLFSIKAEAVGEIAVQRLKEGKKPVIAFASTMESFLNTITNDDGSPVADGDIINSDFSKVFEKRLQSVLKYTVKDGEGESEPEVIDVFEQDLEFQLAYKSVLSKIKDSSIGISSSPIDVVVDVINKAGYTTAEVTGRKRQLKLLGNDTAMIKNRIQVTANDAFRKFNNNQVDCLLINQSGSTGASAHAIPTKNVPPDKVKQRVMIILQAELNINTEVQKRGRINRTGQILKPIYDYVVSAIPAEKRLMVMLQKKLKSLDANTTSSQDQSEELLDVKQVDFLNKYGDQVTVEYLKENPLVNKMIDDPLKLSEEEEGTDLTYPEAAHRVSGRVAILSVKDQELFYSEISQKYVSLMEYLIQTDQNDLKVKKLELDAETLDKEVVVVGREGASVFARNSILEKVRVNNLRKPYTKTEIEVILKESLGDLKPDALQDIQIAKYQAFADSALQQEILDIELHYDELIANVPNEKAIVKIEDSYDRSEAINVRKQNLSEAKTEAVQRAKEISNNKRRVIKPILSNYYVGRVCPYPSPTYSIDRTFYYAIFLGFVISENAKNPYAPSALKLRFAIGGSLRYVALPASKFEILDAISALDNQGSIGYYDKQDALKNWDDLMREKSAEKAIRYVVTGNILQAYGNSALRGSLVSYTTSTGGVKKGILLPESWVKEKQGDKEALRISVPILYAKPIIKSMVDYRTLKTTDNFIIQRQGYNFKLIVMANKKLYGKYFLDQTLSSYTVDGLFNSQSSNMVANVDYSRIDEVIEYLHTKFSASVELIPQEFELIKNQIPIDDYSDEEKQPETDVFIQKLTEVDTQEEARRKTEEEQKAFDDEQKAIADALKKEEEQQAEADAFMLEKRKLAAKKKLVNLLRIFAGKDIIMKKGGQVGSDNAQMVLNNNVQIMHHAQELKDAVKNSKNIPAWVVAKVYDATQTLSDVTHYLDGENKMAKGGTTEQQKKVAKVMHEFKEGELHSGKSGKVVTDPKQAIAIALSESRKMQNGGNLESYQEQAYILGIQASQNDEPRVPAQNRKLMNFVKDNDIYGIKGGFIAVLKSFEKGYFDDNERQVKLKFPEMYKNR